MGKPRLMQLAAAAVCAWVPLELLAGDGGFSVGADVAPKRARRDVGVLLLGPNCGGQKRIGAMRTLRWTDLDRAELARVDRQRALQVGVPMRIGVHRDVPGGPINVTGAGTWSKLADGTAVWSIKLELPDAEAVRVHFSKFDLPRDTRVVLGGDAGTPTTLLEGDDATQRGAFWAMATSGAEVLIEYQDPGGNAGVPRIEIDKVAHIYRGFKTQPPGAVEDESITASALLPCQEDVNCLNGLDLNARDAVARIIFSVPGQGTFVCSGALLNDVDDNTFAGYFLTANHCIDSQTVATSVTAYWFYQTTSCGGSLPSLSTRPRSNRAILLATSSRFLGGNDSTLLRFENDPSDEQGFAAWTTDSPNNNQTVIGIHHPGGSYKRYSMGRVTQQQPICGSLPLTRYLYNDWDVGTTEPGSSGSPLFNENFEVVGQLFGICFFQGTEPGCDNPSDYNNLFGRFSFTFPLISSFLTSVTPDDAFEDNDSIAQAAPLGEGFYELRLVDFDDYFQVTVPDGTTITVTTTSSTVDMDLDLWLRDSSGSVISSSLGLSSIKTVSADVASGTYIIQAEKSKGWGGDYTLDLDIVLPACEPPDQPLAEPDPVTKNRYISLVPGNAGRNVAIRVDLTSLHHPDPPNFDDSPSPSFADLEGTTMWVGTPEVFVDSEPLGTQFHAAPLVCEPNFMDWGDIPLLHVYGPQIVPSSIYTVDVVEIECERDNPENFSSALQLETSRWGDLIPPFQEPAPNNINQPDARDLTALVDKIKELATATSSTRMQLHPALLAPATKPNVADLTAAVDAVKGFAFSFVDTTGCP